MSDRLTPEWTETLDEAFGATGTKGRLGEEFLIESLKTWGWEVNHFESNKKMQTSGIDLEFKDPKWRSFYTGDCKNNMDEFGCFYVYEDWLFKTKADRIFHVNPVTGWIAWYSVEDMRQWYKSDGEYIRIIPSKSPKFIKRRLMSNVSNGEVNDS